ncbi:MAG: hypothetical protein ACYSXF_02950 [Planctomycetota bacterium]|jgi:hypothetical protein
MRRWARLLGAAGLPILGSAQSGCYEHVVRAEGHAGQRMDIHEPNVNDDGGVVGGLEDLLLGEEDKGKQDTRSGRPRNR